ncbi:TEL2-interacting protein-like protein [Emericellopsis cladophorae]|uniref:TEL2-interacting protein-like protein n=1 Tax=Emericellopsis cladophorae TaxID=2686198 RepID=A0A9P9XW42_9HYPO|nr:TEL2-interacting protein-like protein [Emericellopsis cladophorae]KAI6778840.1 TEL2-interacting protein-like protein [Emericellopsis cladophorae]
MEVQPQIQARNEVFQKLKPSCVKVSQLAIRDAASPGSQRELLALTTQILAILTEQVNKNPSSLDEKLAEYVFFPLYHVFRQLDVFSMLLIEKCVRCLRILIEHGWKSKLPGEMVQQILTLVTFIIEGNPGSKKERKEVPEELVLECYRTLSALFRVVGGSIAGATNLAELDAIPALGHGITVILNGAQDGQTDLIQQEALRAVQGIYTSLRDREALANFLPGVVSTVAKMLATPTRYRKKVLVASLETATLVITRVLGDMQTRTILAQAEKEPEASSNDLLSPAWLKATTGQIKVALSGFMKLRGNGSEEVRDALRSLCIRLLDESHTTLKDSASILVETAMIVEDANSKGSVTETSLRDLITIYPELGDKAKTAVYQWMSSLSRLMQSNDEDVKTSALHNISKGIGLLQEMQIESSTLDDTISSTLRDSVVILMEEPKSQSRVTNQAILGNESSLTVQGVEAQYAPVVLGHGSQKETRKEMLGLLGVIGAHFKPSKLVMNLLDYVRTPESNYQIAGFWLCFEIVKAAQSASKATDSVFDLSAFSGPDGGTDDVFQELYSFAVETLDAHTEGEAVDWRLEALSLEVVLHAATRMGKAFRPELIDVLFPVVTLLGSEDHALRQHAIVTLNGMALASGYKDVSMLIIENVDYMVNSIALRLNSLDISPASMQVLTMMIRLAGSRLVPFLDDVVESIFAALENYHGYPVFVESLFAVLKELVDQAIKSDKLLLKGQKTSVPTHRKQRPQQAGLQGLLDFLHRRKQRQEYEAEEAKTAKASQGHPAAPWKDDSQPGAEDDATEEQPPPEPEKPPNSVTYQLLLRITTLTQHYLTSPTPRLRRSLLELLSTASPALAADEEAFLPLVHAVWPVVLSRLYDPETFVAVEACQALSALCVAAGDFLSSRFKTEWSDGLGQWFKKVKRQALATRSHRTATRQTGGDDNIMIPTADGTVFQAKPSAREHSLGSLGQHASPVRLWESAVGLLTSLVLHVQISEDMFEDILGLLTETLEKSAEVREALETINADAVWLLRYEQGHIEPLATPQMEGFTFKPMGMAV